MLVNFLKGNLTDKEYSHMKVENMLANTKIIKGTDRELTHIAMEINMYYGKGTYIYLNGDLYVGEWKKNKYNTSDNLSERDGKGTYFFANGDKYVGEWKKGKKHGQGIFTYISGKIEEGVWKKDKLVTLK